MSFSSEQIVVVADVGSFLQQLPVLEVLDTAVAVLDIQFNYLYKNATFEQLRIPIFDADSAQDMRQDYAEIFTVLAATVASKQRQVCEYRHYYKKNIFVDVHLSFKPIVHAQTHRVAAILCTISEESINFDNKHLAKTQNLLTRLKQRIATLDTAKLNNERLIKYLFLQAPFPMVLLKPDRTILQVNSAAEKLFNIDANKSIGSPCQTILHCYNSCQHCPVLESSNKKIEIDEISGITSTTKTVPLLRSAVLFNNLDMEIILEAFMDISETKKAQQENQAKSTFLANMSHEIRTPLTTIIGYSETLLADQQPAAQQIQSIHTIIRSGKHLQQLINNILDLSKIEAEKLEIENTKLSLFELCAEVEAIAAVQAKDNSNNFGFDFNFPLPECINSDVTRLKQILINLCSNALKFTIQGSVRVQVHYAHLLDQLQFKVVDTGIGMSKEQLAQIFEMFNQAEVSTSRVYGGTGLGLHLSRQLAHCLGGDIQVESRLGCGSCFKLSLNGIAAAGFPLIHAKPSIKVPDSSVSSLIAEQRLSGRVLLVEDNIDNQQLVSMHLMNAGAEVALAENGQQAVDKAMSDSFDLILMDLQMPIMNGLEATKYLRRHGYAGPIVALTANAIQDFVDRCDEVGFNGFLAKPIEKDQFAETLVTYLRVEPRGAQVLKPVVSTLTDEHDDGTSELVLRYVQRLPQHLTQLEQSLQAQDWPALQALCHDLKGSGGGYGFQAVSDLAAQLAMDIRARDEDGIQQRMNSLSNLIQQIELGYASRAKLPEPCR